MHKQARSQFQPAPSAKPRSPRRARSGSRASAPPSSPATGCRTKPAPCSARWSRKAPPSSRAPIRFVGDRIETLVRRARTRMWQQTRHTVETTVRAGADTAVDASSSETLPKSLPKIELPMRARRPARPSAPRPPSARRKAATTPSRRARQARREEGEARRVKTSRRSALRGKLSATCRRCTTTPMRSSMPDTTASGRARAPGAQARAASAAWASRLAGGGPLGRDLRGRRAARADRLARRLDFNDLDVYVGVSSGGFVAAALANGISPAQMYRLFIDDGADAALTPEIFLRPALRRVRAPRALRCRGLAARATLQYLRDPFHRGVMESFATLSHAMPTGVFDNRAIDDFLARAVRRARPHQRLPQARAQAVPRRDQPRHRRVGDLRRARPRPRADLARDRGVGRAARACSRRWRSTASTTSTARSTRRCTRRSRSTRASSCCCASIRWCRSTRAAPAARRPPDRRQAEPGRAAAGAVADLPRDHPLADEGRAWRSTGAQYPGRRHRAVRARPRGRRHVLREHLQLLAAQAAVRRRVPQDAAEPRRARAGRSRPLLAQARHHAAPRPARRPRTATCADALDGPAAAAHATRRQRRPPGDRATSRTRSTSSSAGSPRPRHAAGSRRPARRAMAERNDRAAPASASSRRASTLFNRLGEPHITTADIADEMNISPGNLYYHFRNKDEIIGELYAAYEARVLPLLAVPEDRRRDVEDLWLLLHLLFERMWDVPLPVPRPRRAHVAQPQARAALRRAPPARRRHRDRVVPRHGAPPARCTRREREIAALAQNVVLVATYWHVVPADGRASCARATPRGRPRPRAPTRCWR